MWDGLLSLSAGALGMLGQDRANKANQAMSREQMAFQERMSSTAYQRAMADMQKAGLNPILAGKLGGASSPGGSMADYKDALSSGVNSAVSARRAQAEFHNLQEQNKLLSAQVNATNADAALKIASAKQIGLGYLGKVLGSKGVELATGAISSGLESLRSMSSKPVGGPSKSTAFSSLRMGPAKKVTSSDVFPRARIKPF